LHTLQVRVRERLTKFGDQKKKKKKKKKKRKKKG